MKTHIFGSGTTHFYIGIDNGASAEAEEIYRLASELCGGKEFCFAAFEAENWNDDFSPWQSEPVFGDKGFSGNAKKTLETIEKEVIPFVRESRGTPERQFIAGYSLSGLFALWSCFESDIWDGAAVCSGSLWYPQFREYVMSKEVPRGKFYFSLGDKESKTKNKAMSCVEDVTLEICAKFGVPLDFQQGGHFKDCALRTAKGIAFLNNAK